MIRVDTATRTDFVGLLTVKRESNGEFFQRIRPLFTDSGQKAVDEALEQKDEKLALVGVLLYVVRPEMEENEELIEIEEEILARIGDDEFVAEMEAIDQQKRMLEALAEGSREGMKEGVRALTRSATNVVRRMDVSLESLKAEVGLFHEERRKEIEQTTARIRELRRQEEEQMASVTALLGRALGVGVNLKSLEDRVGSAVDKVEELKWMV